MTSVDEKLFLKLSKLREAVDNAVVQLLVDVFPHTSSQGKRRVTFATKKCINLSKEAWQLTGKRAKK